jgi:oligopeptide transport system substrate-binding protein
VKRLLPAALVLALANGACAPARAPIAHTAASEARYFGDITPPTGDVFTFNNNAEPETTDPSVMSGQPDGRVARMLFEGLVVPDPKTLAPTPGQAYRWEISPDGLTYTFHLRPGLVWSDGTPLTARDFVYSWRRVLRPETASRSASLMYAIRNGEAFNKGTLKDESQVGVAAPDDSTVVATLESPTAYFLFLTQFYTYVPVPQHAIETFGPRWTLPANMVGNGPFKLAYWRQNDRFEFVPNPRYWDRAAVKLDRIIAYSVDDLNTSTNLYKAGVTDWNTSGSIPAPFLPYMRQYADFRSGDYQGTYFYSVNVTEKPLNNVWVRRALEYAIDRESITRDLLKGSRRAWGNIVPSGYPGYEKPEGYTYDPVKARADLARGGYPGGKGFPKISILFNTSDDHRRIAEAVQAMWKRELAIDVELSNQEWGSYLQATTSLHYQVARRSWIGDYLDPNTFLNMLVSGDGNNRTGFSDPHYDALIHAAAREVDPAARMKLLRDAEALALDQAVYIPIYHYSTTELVKPYVRGLYQNALDTHPMKGVWIDHAWRPHTPAPLAAAGERPHP